MSRGKAVQIRLPMGFLGVVQRKAADMNLSVSTFIRSSLYSTLSEEDKTIAQEESDIHPCRFEPGIRRSRTPSAKTTTGDKRTKSDKVTKAKTKTKSTKATKATASSKTKTRVKKKTPWYFMDGGV